MVEIHEEEIWYSHHFIIHAKSILLLSEFTPSKLLIPIFVSKCPLTKVVSLSRPYVLYSIHYLISPTNVGDLCAFGHFASSGAVNTTLMGSENMVEWKQGAANKHKGISNSVPGRDQLFSVLQLSPCWVGRHPAGRDGVLGIWGSGSLMVRKGEPQDG